MFTKLSDWRKRELGNRVPNALRPENLSHFQASRAGAGLNLTFGSPHSGWPGGGHRRNCGNHPWAMNVVCDSFNLVVDHIHPNC